MTDGVTENGGCHGGQKKKIYIYIIINNQVKKVS